MILDRFQFFQLGFSLLRKEFPLCTVLIFSRGTLARATKRIFFFLCRHVHWFTTNKQKRDKTKTKLFTSVLIKLSLKPLSTSLHFAFSDLVTAAMRVVLLLRHHKYLPTVDRSGEKFNATDFNAEKRFSAIAQIPKTLRTLSFWF